MIIQFSLENYLSFKNKTTLSLESGERLRKFNDTNTIKTKNNRLLKNVMLFGPNGSGKSNIVNGLQTFKKLVLKKTSFITSDLPYIPFLLNSDTQNSPTTFEIEFIINKFQYRYTISYIEDMFTYEHLECFVGKNYKTYFKRTEQTFNTLPSGMKGIAKKTRKNMLFLYLLQDSNDLHGVNVTSWFSDYLLLCDSNELLENIDILKNKRIKELFLKLLKVADFNINDVEMNKKVRKLSTEEQEVFRNIMAPLSKNNNSNMLPVPESRVEADLWTIYNFYDENQEKLGVTKIPFELESSGTKKFIHIILSILNAGNSGKVLIFDEFDDSFHLAISQALIKIFNSKSNYNQFILTSHELQHLDCDIRKDQIYLIEKDFDGESNIFSLFDFNNLEVSGFSNSYSNKNSRHDLSFFKRYINGQFGANPQVDTAALSELMNEFNESNFNIK